MGMDNPIVVVGEAKHSEYLYTLAQATELSRSV